MSRRRVVHHKHTAMRERELKKFYDEHTWVSAGYPNAQWVKNDVLERVNAVVPDTQNYAFVLKMVRSGEFDQSDEEYFSEEEE